MTTQTDAAAAPSPPLPGFEEVYHPRAGAVFWRTVRFMVVLMGVAIGLSVALSILIVSAGHTTEIAIGLLVIIAIVALWIRRLSMARMRQKIGECGDKPLAAVLGEVFPLDAGLPLDLRPVVKELALRGRAGVSARMSGTPFPTPIDPLVTTFEPTPIDESDPHFRELEPEPTTLSEAQSARQATRGELDARDAVRRFRRNVTLLGGWGLIAIFGVNFLISAWESWNRKTISWRFCMWGIYLAATIFGLGGRGAWTARQKWMLVPGGLVSWGSTFWRGESQVHLFYHQDSVLLAVPASRKVWSVAVADRTEGGQLRVTEREAILLLRGWLSPVPPPPPEQLSDLISA